MTKEATEFITPLTLRTLSQRAVAVDLWDKNSPWKPEHIDVAEWADALLVAPATAHIIACFANGLAPEIVSTTYLATNSPVVIAPAMNEKMLAHPATQKNLEILRSRGNVIVEPKSGQLACGVFGKGKLAAPAKIVEKLAAALKSRRA